MPRFLAPGVGGGSPRAASKPLFWRASILTRVKNVCRDIPQLCVKINASCVTTFNRNSVKSSQASKIDGRRKINASLYGHHCRQALNFLKMVDGDGNILTLVSVFQPGSQSIVGVKNWHSHSWPQASWRPASMTSPILKWRHLPVSTVIAEKTNKNTWGETINE